MKIVIDTDVFLSALFSKKGASHILVRWIREQYVIKSIQHNVVSNTQVTEFSDVFTRAQNLSRANLSQKEAEIFIDAICLISFHQKIHYLWRPFLRDINDDMVLEVAFNSNAEYIITHNIKDFKGVEDKFNIQILTPKLFLEKIGELP